MSELAAFIRILDNKPRTVRAVAAPVAAPVHTFLLSGINKFGYSVHLIYVKTGDNEVWKVRTDLNDGTSHGQGFRDKLAALDYYNARAVGVFVAVA